MVTDMKTIISYANKDGVGDSLGCLDATSRRILIIATLIMAFFHYLDIEIVSMIVTVLFIGVLLFRRQELAFSVFLISTAFISSVPYLVVGFIAIIVCSFFIRGKIVTTRTAMYGLLVAVFVLLLTYLLGYKPSSNKFILALISIFVIFMVHEIYRDYSVILYSYFMIPFGMIIVILLMLASGQNVLFLNRLCFDGNIRVLANAVVIPLYYCIVCMFWKKRIFSHLTNRTQTLITIALFVVLILTASRGAIIAFLCCMVAAVLMSGGIGKNFKKWFLVITLAVVFVYLFLNAEGLNLDRLFVDRQGGFNGRTDIWAYYFTSLKDGGILRILFGFGPGNISRIALGTEFENAYSHSTYFDILFSHGLIGGVLFVVVVFSILKYIFNSSNKMLIPVVIGLFINYSTHGVVFNTDLYVNMVLIGGLCQCFEYKERTKICTDSNVLNGEKK